MMGNYSTKQLVFKGTPTLRSYRGTDDETNRGISLKDGESAEIGEKTADRLLRDFPENFSTGAAPRMTGTDSNENAGMTMPKRGRPKNR